ncbi:MAG: type III pantothenate kinase, partial [Bacteroidota bacterium]
LQEKFHFIELDEKTPIPLKNRYQTPATLGKDRLAAAVGGHSLFPGHDVLVINAGTCVTYDVVTREGEYLGGAISPGMVMRFRALHTFTGKLPLLDFTEEPDFPGNTTEKSIISGVINGMIAEMEAIATGLGVKYPDLQVILSGGDLNYFDKRLKISIFALPNIVVYGLYQILKLNVDPIR